MLTSSTPVCWSSSADWIDGASRVCGTPRGLSLPDNNPRPSRPVDERLAPTTIPLRRDARVSTTRPAMSPLAEPVANSQFPRVSRHPTRPGGPDQFRSSPLAVVGVTAVDGDCDGALGAPLLFSTNALAIIVVGALLFGALRIRRGPAQDPTFRSRPAYPDCCAAGCPRAPRSSWTASLGARLGRQGLTLSGARAQDARRRRATAPG
jgi:hypothetical protein